MGCSVRSEGHLCEPPERCSAALQSVYLLSLSLSRMSGEHPSSVSICKYLQAWVLCVVTYQKSELPIP